MLTPFSDWRHSLESWHGVTQKSHSVLYLSFFFCVQKHEKERRWIAIWRTAKKIPKNQKPQPNKKTPHLLQPEFWEDQFLCPLFYTSQTKANMFKSQVMWTGKQHLLMHREFWFKPDKAEKQWFCIKKQTQKRVIWNFSKILEVSGSSLYFLICCSLVKKRRKKALFHLPQPCFCYSYLCIFLSLYMLIF